MLSLRQKQSQFVLLVAKLIAYAYSQGYELTFGETYRTPEQAARDAANGTGIKNSLHTRRLAIDLNLFKGGVWLQRTEDFLPLGEWWEAQSTANYECCWGGRFTRKDGNHFSLADGGQK